MQRHPTQSLSVDGGDGAGGGRSGKRIVAAPPFILKGQREDRRQVTPQSWKTRPRREEAQVCRILLHFQNSDFLARNCSDQKLQFSVSASMPYFGECLGLIHT